MTGGAKRIGRCITETLLPEFRVAFQYFESHNDAVSLEARYADAIPFQFDLTRPGAPAKLIEAVIEKTGHLDLLVNNAALFYSDTADLVKLAKMKTLNVDAPYKLIDAARPYLSKRAGQVINIADIAGIHNFQKYKAYSRSKAALLEYAVSNALALAREQIRINTVCPGLVLPSPSQQNTDTLDVLQQQIPLQRIGKPADVADLVAFLARSEFITGQIIAVDGGRLLQYALERNK